MTIDPNLMAIIRAVVESADDEGCDGDLTVASKSAIADLADYARSCNWLWE